MYLNFLDQTRLPYSHSFHTKLYSNSIHPYFHTNIHSFIPVIFSFLFLLSSFFSLLLLLLLLPFSSLLSSPFLLLPLRPKMRYLFLVLSLFVLIPFLFHFPRRKLPPSFLQATCLFHNFSSLFHYNIFLLLPFGPHFHFYSHSIYQNPTLTYKLIKL